MVNGEKRGWRFHPLVEEWWKEHFAAPTPPQEQGWPAVQRGENVLIVAPTGSGKTLAGFLAFVDFLVKERTGGKPSGPGVRVVYVSPLRALDNDVHANLTPALSEINARAEKTIARWRPLRAAVRTGDTPAHERRRQARQPPDFLITTPESLFLLLASPRARSILRTVAAVIVDELHALAPNKRGAQLALALEWLEWWAGRPLQRVGLSATQRPLSRMAAFLGGDRPVTVVDTGLRKEMRLRVLLPAPDLRSFPEGSVWPSLYRRLYGLIVGDAAPDGRGEEPGRRRPASTLVFVNSRAQAEKVTARLNEIASKSEKAAGVAFPAASHHGSLSRAVREQVEKEFKRGRIPVVVATGSLELGIDVGTVDLAVQVESPHSVTRGLQRIGRAGHLYGAESRGVILPKTRADLLEAAVTARAVLSGDIEPVRLPHAPLDVLAQTVAAMVALDDWRSEELYRLVRRAGPYRELTQQAFHTVLRLLAGEYRHPLLAGPGTSPGTGRLRPRLLWDHASDMLHGLPGTRLLVARQGGTIPDRGTYGVYTVKDRRHLGELDEEFVYETRRGDVILLGTTACRVERLEKDRVLVEPLSEGVSRAGGAYEGTGERLPVRGVPLVRLPFWRGEGVGRTSHLGLLIARFLRQVNRQLDGQFNRARKGRTAGGGAEARAAAVQALAAGLKEQFPLDDEAASALAGYLVEEYHQLGCLPSDRCVVVEHFPDVNGDPLILIHAPFGRSFNRAWKLALGDALAERWGVEPQILASDDGLLLRLPAGIGPGFGGRSDDLPAFLISLVRAVGPEQVVGRVLRALKGSALLGAAFRAAAGRALLISRGGRGRRLPLWLQRLQAQDLLEATRHFPDFPVLVEAIREVTEEVLDLPLLRAVLYGISRGRVAVVPHVSRLPSPFAAGLLFDYAGAFVYEGDEPRRSGGEGTTSRTAGTYAGPAGPDEAGWLLATVALAGGDLRHRLDQEILAQLVAELEPPAPPAAVSDDETTGVDHRRLAAYALTRGPFTLMEAAVDLAGSPDVVPGAGSTGGGERETALARLRRAIDSLLATGELVAGRFRTTSSEEEYCQVDFLRQWLRRTLIARRRRVSTVPFGVYLAFLFRRHLPVAGHHSEPAPPYSAALSRRLGEAIRALAGLPFSWETWVEKLLPPRLGAGPGAEVILEALAELTRSGRLFWQAAGNEGDPPSIRFFTPGFPAIRRGAVGTAPPAGEPDRPVPPGLPDEPGPSGELVEGVLRERGALFLHQIDAEVARRGYSLSREEVVAALVQLACQGRVTSDSPRLLPLLPLLAREAEHAGRSRLAPDAIEKAGARPESPAVPVVRLGGPGRPPRTRRLYREARRRARETVWRRMHPGAARRGSPGAALSEAVADGRWWALDSSTAAATVTPGEAAVMIMPGGTAADPLEMVFWRWTETVLDLYHVLSPSIWNTWRRLASGGDQPDPSLPSWSELYSYLRRWEWQGRLWRGRFVEELDDPQFTGAAEAINPFEGTTASIGPARFFWLSARDPLNPYGRLANWPHHQPLSAESWLLWRLAGQPAAGGGEAGSRRAAVGQAELLLLYSASSGLLQVEPAFERLSAADRVEGCRQFTWLLTCEPLARRTHRLEVNSCQFSPASPARPIWGTPVEQDLRAAGFRSSTRGLVLMASSG